MTLDTQTAHLVLALAYRVRGEVEIVRQHIGKAEPAALACLDAIDERAVDVLRYAREQVDQAKSEATTKEKQ